MNNLMKKYREQKGMTQQQIADKLEISVNSYNMIENGKRGVSVIMAKNISVILEKSIDEIFFAKWVHIMWRNNFIISFKFNKFKSNTNYSL